MPKNTKSNAVPENVQKILNYIRQDASTYYKDYVPQASVQKDNIKQIGNIIMGDATLRNEFISALVNRIGFVTLTNRIWENPWAVFNKGLVEYGTTVEEIFVDLAKPFQYNAEVGVTNQYAREIPDVKSAFHVMNWQKFFKVTIQEKDLKQAFLGWEGVQDLISKVIESMSTGLNYAVYQTIKYMIARVILKGQMNAQEIPAPTAANAKEIVADVKALSNDWTILNRNNNIAGVANHTPKDDQYLILTNKFDAIMDVEVLAAAFNMDKTEFYGHRLLVDGFGEIDNDFLEDLFTDASGNTDPGYVALTDDEKTALNQIPGVMFDGKFMQIYENMHEMTEKFNGESIYWNYWLHEWMTFSVSPFAQRACLVPTTPAITSVTVSPDAVTASVGNVVQLTATVVTAGFAPQTVTWSSADTDVATVDAQGKVTIVGGTAEDTVVITATSTEDSTKTGTCTITIA